MFSTFLGIFEDVDMNLVITSCPHGRTSSKRSDILPHFQAVCGQSLRQVLSDRRCCSCYHGYCAVIGPGPGKSSDWLVSTLKDLMDISFNCHWLEKPLPISQFPRKGILISNLKFIVS